MTPCNVHDAVNCANNENERIHHEIQALPRVEEIYFIFNKSLIFLNVSLSLCGTSTEQNFAVPYNSIVSNGGSSKLCWHQKIGCHLLLLEFR